MSRSPAILLTLIGLAACASPGSGGAPAADAAGSQAAVGGEGIQSGVTPAAEAGRGPAASTPTEAMVQAGFSSPTEFSFPAGGTPQTPQQPRQAEPDGGDEGPWMSEQDLALLRGPEFRQRFAESYLSATEIEPQYSDDDREVLQEVLDLINWTPPETEGEPTEAQVAANERTRKEKEQEAFELLKENLGTNPVYDFFLGNLYLQNGQLAEAKPHYVSATLAKPNFRRAWGNLGQVHFQLEEYAQALRALGQVVKLGGGDALTYGLMGVSAMRIEDPIAAESAFRMAAMLQPDKLDWKLGIGEAFFKQRRFAEAAALFDLLIAKEPDNAQLWLAQGEAFARQGKVLKAAENFEMLDRLGGATVDSLYNLGDIYANEGLFEPAVTAYVRAMEKDPKRSPDRVLRAARFMAGSEALEEADALLASVERIYQESLEDKQRKDLLRVKARLAVARGNDTGEAAILEEIVALDPLDGDALILLGQQAGRLGDVERAILYFERAAQLEDFEADAKVRHAQLLVREGRYAEAVPLLRQAQSVKPREAIGAFLEQVERRAKTQG